MDRSSEKQAEMEAKKAAATLGYASLWQQVVSEWARPEESDRAWLLYSANYLLRSAGVRWALDPLTLHHRLPSAAEVDHSGLAPVEYIVLTHRHSDHLDLDLLRHLREFPAQWIVPEPLLELLKPLDLPGGKIRVAVPLEPICLGALTLTPFDGMHWAPDPENPGRQRGVPATGYLAEFNSKRWLFPGDTRTYDAKRLPRLGPVDGLVAHLWLGRGRALDGQFPLLEAFCRFCLELEPKQILVTHLDEFGRRAEETWDAGHFKLVKEWFSEHAPHIGVGSANMGESHPL